MSSKLEYTAVEDIPKVRDSSLNTHLYVTMLNEVH